MLKGMYQIACSIDCLFLWNPIRSCFVGFFMHIIFQDKQALLCFGFILHFEKYNFDLILVCLLMNFNNIDFVLDCPIFSDQWSIDFFHSLRLHFLFPSFFENLILFLNTFFFKEYRIYDSTVLFEWSANLPAQHDRHFFFFFLLIQFIFTLLVLST